MEIKYLNEQGAYKECLERIEKIKADTNPKWGKMNAAQLFAHLAEVQEVINGGKTLQNTSWFIKALSPVIKRAVLSGKPYPKNTRTHPQYITSLEERNFNSEKDRFLNSLEKLQQMSDQEALAAKHPLFGKMNLKEKGWASYKHLNHHLEQFGV